MLIIEFGAETGRRFVVRPGQQFVLGRGQGVTIRLEDDLISRRHARVELKPDGWLYLCDLGSRNGTFFQGKPLEAHIEQQLSSGDRVQLGRECVIRIELLGVSKPAQSFLPPEEFEILGELGEGASSRVVSARQRLLDRVVAVKLLWADEDAERQRIVREARVAQKIRSPYVVQVHDIRQFGPNLCLIMELVNGPNLKDQLGSPAVLVIPQALAVAEDVARALIAAHAEGVIHRDIKPANIIVHPDGYAMLADFGLAKDMASEGDLTASNVGLGSLSYVSPEQARGARRADERSDVYSLGATLYHLIGQRPPVTGSSMPQILADIVEGQPPQLTELEPTCPADVAAYVHSLLDKEPDARPQSAAAMARSLAELRQQHYPDFVACVPGRRTENATQTRISGSNPLVLRMRKT